MSEWVSDWLREWVSAVCSWWVWVSSKMIVWVGVHWRTRKLPRSRGEWIQSVLLHMQTRCGKRNFIPILCDTVCVCVVCVNPSFRISMQVYVCGCADDCVCIYIHVNLYVCKKMYVGWFFVVGGGFECTFGCVCLSVCLFRNRFYSILILVPFDPVAYLPTSTTPTVHPIYLLSCSWTVVSARLFFLVFWNSRCVPVRIDLIDWIHW